jgi:predicted Zn finger-like uncharacterized protein
LRCHIFLATVDEGKEDALCVCLLGLEIICSVEDRAMAVATTCPRCGTEYILAEHLRGKTVRCKKCQGAIVVGEEAAPKVQPKSTATVAKKPAPRATDESPNEPPKRKRRPEEERTAQKRPRKSGGSRGLLVGLIVAGVGLFLVCGGVLTFLLMTGKLGNKGPDYLVDVSGKWPEPMDFPPIMGNVDRNTAVVIRVANALDEEMRQDVGERLSYLADSPFVASTGASKDNRLAIRMSPVKDPQAFADKIDFATVRSVSGRTITIVARKPEGPMSDPDDVVKALARLKLPYSAARKKAAILLKGKNLDERRAELLRKPDPRQAEVLRGLEAALSEPERYTREEVYHALGVWGTKDTVPVLVKELQKEDTRLAVLQALGRIKDPSASEQIAACLTNFPTMWTAAEALKAIGPAAEPAALKYLNHDKQVCMMVCGVLGKIGGPRSLAELEKLTCDPDTAISSSAKGTIDAIQKRR